MLTRLSVKQITLGALLLVLSLACYQLFQLYDLFEQKHIQLNEDLGRVLKNVAFIHEKENDYLKINGILQNDFKEQSKKVVAEEFERMLAGRQQVAIHDTLLVINNQLQPYLVIRGSASDTLSGISTQQVTFIRDIRQLQDFAKTAQSSKNQSKNITVHLNQELLQHIFKKAKFMNELMLQAFQENLYKDPSERINPALLEKLIYQELSKANLPRNFEFNVFNEEEEPFKLQISSKSFKATRLLKGLKTRLYPTDRFNEKLYLEVALPTQSWFVLRQMKSYFLVTLIFGFLLLLTFYSMIKTIKVQRSIDSMKSAFVSNMTHEFKTPISTISLACQAMSDKDILSSTIRQEVAPYLGMIDQENKRLEALVEGILQSSLGADRSIPLRLEPLDMLQIVREQIKLQEFKLNDQGIIKLEIVGTPQKAKGDRFHTMNLVANLLENAVKYSTNPVTIEVSLLYNNPTVFCVKDRGIGIAKEHIPKVFDRFYRVPTGDVHNVKGFGLGLSYVKSVADAHGWVVNVTSVVGEGSTFKVIITS